MNTIRVSNSFNPDQARHFVGPDLGLNCLQSLSADDTTRQRVNDLICVLLVQCDRQRVPGTARLFLP